MELGNSLATSAGFLLMRNSDFPIQWLTQNFRIMSPQSVGGAHLKNVLANEAQHIIGTVDIQAWISLHQC